MDSNVESRKSHLGIIILVIVLCIAFGVAGFFGGRYYYDHYDKKDDQNVTQKKEDSKKTSVDEKEEVKEVDTATEKKESIYLSKVDNHGINVDSSDKKVVLSPKDPDAGSYEVILSNHNLFITKEDNEEKLVLSDVRDVDVLDVGGADIGTGDRIFIYMMDGTLTYIDANYIETTEEDEIVMVRNLSNLVHVKKVSTVEKTPASDDEPAFYNVFALLNDGTKVDITEKTELN